MNPQKRRKSSKKKKKNIIIPVKILDFNKLGRLFDYSDDSETFVLKRAGSSR